ncbi:MAG: hypothetical protein MZW92_18170 [Comamonadaceae bacterium]|nr:hypothetical protein [Comamonadaceae bacterium]
MSDLVRRSVRAAAAAADRRRRPADHRHPELRPRPGFRRSSPRHAAPQCVERLRNMRRRRRDWRWSTWDCRPRRTARTRASR